jgi:hypothetical protein
MSNNTIKPQPGTVVTPNNAKDCIGLWVQFDDAPPVYVESIAKEWGTRHPNCIKLCGHNTEGEEDHWFTWDGYIEIKVVESPTGLSTNDRLRIEAKLELLIEMLHGWNHCYTDPFDTTPCIMLSDIENAITDYEQKLKSNESNEK